MSAAKDQKLLEIRDLSVVFRQGGEETGPSDSVVELDLTRPRHGGPDLLAERLSDEPGEHEARCPTDEREHDVLGQELPRQSATART